MKLESLINKIETTFKTIAPDTTLALDATLVTPHLDVLVAHGCMKAEKTNLSVEILIEQGEISAVKGVKAAQAPEIIALAQKKRSIKIDGRDITPKINYEQLKYLTDYLKQHQWVVSLIQTRAIPGSLQMGCTGIDVTVSCATSDLIAIHIKMDYFGNAIIEPENAASYLISKEDINLFVGVPKTSEKILAAIDDLSQATRNKSMGLFQPIAQHQSDQMIAMKLTLSTVEEEDEDEDEDDNDDEGYVTPPLAK